MGARATLLFGTIWGLVLTYGSVSLYLIAHEPADILLALLTTGIAACCVLVLCGVSRLLLIVPLVISFALLARVYRVQTLKVEKAPSWQAVCHWRVV